MREEQKIFKSIAEYYDNLLAQHGHNSKACDWPRPASQTVRFRVLAEVASFDQKRILDVGCGLADFAGFLKTRYKEVRYVGVDISTKMIEEAKKLHPELDLRVQNILVDDPGRFDFVVASGIFARLGKDAIPISKKLISRMFECAECAIAFNSLSAWAPNKEEDEFYHDPLETLLFARSLSPWVVLRHDYHPRDFTIYVYRGASS